MLLLQCVDIALMWLTMQRHLMLNTEPWTLLYILTWGIAVIKKLEIKLCLALSMRQKRKKEEDLVGTAHAIATSFPCIFFGSGILVFEET